MSKPPKPLSEGEELFALNCKVLRIPFEREFVFDPSRKWKADFYIRAPHKELIVEIEGGTWSGGRHVRPAGFEADIAKYNRAAILGYTVLRYSTSMVKRGDAMEDLEAILGIKSNWREE
jgi:hypothetical protein